MKAIVMAAGLGKRLAAITSETPKVLVKIGEKSLIEHSIDKLHKIGINDIALVIGYKGEMVKEVLGNSVTYYEQCEQLGTAHAFLCAEKFIDEPYFLGMNGDMFFTDPLTEFIKLKPPAAAVYHVEDTRRYGRMEIKGGRLVAVKEKVEEKTPGFLNAGVYLFPKQIFEGIRKTPLSPRKEYEITDTIQMMINQGLRFTVYELKDFWTDIAYQTDLEKARNFISGRGRDVN
jgi:bifunctional UDP-N-acetylglucosamine pyrophosphorylase/glucosamine-1-phosphate N-acetyltransferase